MVCSITRWRMLQAHLFPPPPLPPHPPQKKKKCLLTFASLISRCRRHVLCRLYLSVTSTSRKPPRYLPTGWLGGWWVAGGGGSGVGCSRQLCITMHHNSRRWAHKLVCTKVVVMATPVSSAVAGPPPGARLDHSGTGDVRVHWSAWLAHCVSILSLSSSARCVCVCV